MLAHGNANPSVCALNLLRTIRGEVPFARVKGIDREHIDRPITEEQSLRADALWLIETFEPRAVTSEVETLAQQAIDGDIGLYANVDK